MRRSARRSTPARTVSQSGHRSRYSPRNGTRLHPVPAVHTVAFGTTRVVPAKVVIVHVSDDGPVEVARHARATPGTPRIDDDHFPPQPSGPLDRRPRARNAAESEFLDLGEGARLWLVEAAAAGTPRMRVKMTEALALAKLFDPVEVDWALGHAAVHGRFAEADLSWILDHHARAPKAGEHRASEHSSLTQGTSAWAQLGRPDERPSPSTAGQDEVLA